jgi:RNA polymerase sigma factor (sigma-70 family)
MEAATLTPLAPGRRAGAPDDTLVARARAGDDRAFETLYHRYHRRIAAYVLGMVKDHQRAEDVTQEVFLNALRRMRATDRPIAFRPWLYEIARNACIDQHRRARRGQEVSYDADGAVAPLVSPGPAPDAAVAAKQQLDDLRGAFGGLSEAHHRILVLRELEGRSYAEIGERLDMSVPAVESTLFRARRRLGEEYGELASGERCRRVQAIVAAADDGALGPRDRRTMARHVAHCQPCRHVAMVAGLGHLVPARTGLGAKIAALLPLPGALRDRLLGVGSQHASATAHGGGAASASVTAWAHAAAPVLDSGSSGWAKAVAAVVALAAAGAGAGAVHQHRDGHDARPVPASVARQASVVAGGGTTVPGAAAASSASAASGATGARAGTSGRGASHRPSGTTTVPGAGLAGAGTTLAATAPSTTSTPTSGSGGGGSTGADSGASGAGSSSSAASPSGGGSGSGGGSASGSGGGSSTSAPAPSSPSSPAPSTPSPTSAAPAAPSLPSVTTTAVDTATGVVGGVVSAVTEAVTPSQSTSSTDGGPVTSVVGEATQAVDHTVTTVTSTADQAVHGVADTANQLGSGLRGDGG